MTDEETPLGPPSTGGSMLCARALRPDDRATTGASTWRCNTCDAVLYVGEDRTTLDAAMLVHADAGCRRDV
jgi:hypothetical protein